MPISGNLWSAISRTSTADQLTIMPQLENTQRKSTKNFRLKSVTDRQPQPLIYTNENPERSSFRSFSRGKGARVNDDNLRGALHSSSSHSLLVSLFVYRIYASSRFIGSFYFWEIVAHPSRAGSVEKNEVRWTRAGWKFSTLAPPASGFSFVGQKKKTR